MLRFRAFILIVIVSAASAAAQEERDEEFIQALMARGYFDLVELQYDDWLGAPGLTPDQITQLKHGLVRVYTEWAEASPDPNQKKERWDRAIGLIDALLAGKLSSRDRTRFEIDLGIIFLNKGNSELPAASSGSSLSRERAEQDLKKSIEVLRRAQEEVVKLLEESFALGGDQASSARQDLVTMTLEAEFRLAWALYGLAQVVANTDTVKHLLLAEAEQRFNSIAQSCPGTTAASESCFGIALCRHALRDLTTADKGLRDLLRVEKRNALRKKIYYQLAVVSQEMGQAGDAIDAANASLRILPGRATGPSDSDMENACRLVIAKSLYTSAARGKGDSPEKQRAEAAEILKQLDSLGGRWAAAAREVLIAQAKSEGGRYKELAEAEAKIANGDDQGAIKNIEAFLSAGKEKMEPALRADLLYKMGLCWSKLKSDEKAAESFQAASDAGGSAEFSSRAAYYAVISYGNQFSKSRDKKDGQAYVASLERLLERFPRHAERDDVRYRLARILEEEKKFAEAVAQYEQIDGDSPLRRRAADRAAACIERALRAAWAKGESVKGEKESIAKAKALLTEAAAPVPKEERGGKGPRPKGAGEANTIAASACVRLARLCLNDRVNEPRAAIQLLADFAEKYPGEKEALGDALFVEAWALGKAGKLDEGLTRLREAQAAFPKSDRAGPAAITLALGLERRAADAKPEAAKKARETATELFQLALASPGCGEEESIQMWLHLAELYVQAANWAQAKQAYLSLQQIYPNALNVREGLARCYTGLSDFQKALDEWRVVEQADEPGSEKWWEAKYMIVLMHYRMRNYGEVLKIIRVTKALRPSLGGPELAKKFLELEKRCQ